MSHKVGALIQHMKRHQRSLSLPLSSLFLSSSHPSPPNLFPEERPFEDIARRWSPTSHTEGSCQKPIMLVPWVYTPHLQNSGEENVYCLSSSVCGILYWPPDQLIQPPLWCPRKGSGSITFRSSGESEKFLCSRIWQVTISKPRKAGYSPHCTWPCHCAATHSLITSRDLSLNAHWNNLRALKKTHVWVLPPPPPDSDLIGLECGLGIRIFKSSPNDSKVEYTGPSKHHRRKKQVFLVCWGRECSHLSVGVGVWRGWQKKKHVWTQPSLQSHRRSMMWSRQFPEKVLICYGDPTPFVTESYRIFKSCDQ